MSVTHRPIPALPACPRVQSIAKEIRRSYPTGRQEFSRAVSGGAMELTISASEPFGADVRANLVTTLNAKEAGEWTPVPFVRVDERTFGCRIVPERTGLYSFWAQFSLDGGASWVHDPVPDAWVLVDPPQVDRMRMYTLIPSVSGTIADWSKELAKIKELGFNAVHLLPLTTLDTSLSPYAARDLFDVDPSYLAKGTGRSGLAQLEQFIENAKSLDIRLCFDLVLNHVGTDSNMVKKAPEWIVPDHASPDGLRRARYWSDKGWLPWNDLVLIDYEHPSQRIRGDIWAYMTEYALFWANYANETNGFVRFDNLHSSDKGFVDSVTKRLARGVSERGDHRGVFHGRRHAAQHDSQVGAEFDIGHAVGQSIRAAVAGLFEIHSFGVGARSIFHADHVARFGFARAGVWGGGIDDPALCRCRFVGNGGDGNHARGGMGIEGADQLYRKASAADARGPADVRGLSSEGQFNRGRATGVCAGKTANSWTTIITP